MNRVEWSAGSLLHLSGAYWEGFALHAAVKLNVFSSLGDEALGQAELAGKLGLDRRALSFLLRALCAMGLLRREGADYRNTDEAKKFLCQQSPGYVGHMIMHHHFLVDAWSRLDEAVRQGRPVRGRPVQDEVERESFLMGMYTLAMGIAPTLVKAIDLGGRSRLIDLGGGPGTYAIHFCMANPELKSWVYDLPTTRPFAEKTIARFGMQERVGFIEGDYLEDAIDGTYEAAWLSQILHGEEPEAAAGTVAKAAAALEPGGLLFIHEFILDDTGDGPLFAALFALNMLVNTPGGQSYSQAEIAAMMAGAGLKNIKRLPFRGPNDSAVMVGERG